MEIHKRVHQLNKVYTPNIWFESQFNGNEIHIFRDPTDHSSAEQWLIRMISVIGESRIRATYIDEQVGD